MSLTCTKEFTITVNPACTDFGHTLSQTVAKADGTTTRAPLNVCYDSTNDVFYSVATSSSVVFAVNPVSFAQLWKVSAGTGGYQGQVLFVPETGFLYYCNRNNGLYEINVATNLVSRLIAYGGGIGTGPSHICYRPSDNSLFTCGDFNAPFKKVDAAAFTILLTNNTTLLTMISVLYCPLTDKIYAYGRTGISGTAGLSCINPDTLAIEATISNSVTYYKFPTYSPVSEQIYIVREAFPVFQLLVIDPVFNTVVDTINITPYFPTTTASQSWKCYALGCNVYIFSGQTNEYAVFKAKDNSLVASGTYTQIPSYMASGKDTTEGIGMVANIYPSPYCRLTPP